MSQEFSLSNKDKSKWSENQLEFLKPLILFVAGLYFAPIINNLSQVGHVVSIQDFIPSSAVVTAVTLYLINALWDILRKWSSKTSK